MLPHYMKERDYMEMQYRLNQERLLSQHKLNQEILIHSLARLNKRINTLYGNIIKRQAKLKHYNGLGYGLYIQNEIDNYINELNRLKDKSKPILHLIMKAYRLSLDDVKQLLSQADKEKFPTYKTIDNIVDMLECFDYSLE